jgi:hypothetical protein
MKYLLYVILAINRYNNYCSGLKYLKCGKKAF